MLKIIFFFIISFFIGGIPTGYIAVRLAEKKDIRKYGSGNIGFTNVFRVSGFKIASIVLVIDIAKAFLTTYYFASFAENFELFRLLFGLTVILGNIFSPYLKFKGGKGVATGLGVAIAVSPYGVVASLIVFLIVVFVFRYVSLGSLSAAFTFLISNIYLYLRFEDIYQLVFSIILFVSVVLTHRENIKRLISGTENKIGKRKE